MNFIKIKIVIKSTNPINVHGLGNIFWNDSFDVKIIMTIDISDRIFIIILNRINN